MLQTAQFQQEHPPRFLCGGAQVLDIEATLRAATHKLLHDKGPPGNQGRFVPELAKKRAQALCIVGRAFSNAECDDSAGAGSAAQEEAPAPTTGAASGAVKGARVKKTWRDHLNEQVGQTVVAAPHSEKSAEPES